MPSDRAVLTDRAVLSGRLAARTRATADARARPRSARAAGQRRGSAVSERVPRGRAHRPSRPPGRARRRRGGPRSRARGRSAASRGSRSRGCAAPASRRARPSRQPRLVDPGVEGGREGAARRALERPEPFADPTSGRMRRAVLVDGVLPRRRPRHGEGVGGAACEHEVEPVDVGGRRIRRHRLGAHRAPQPVGDRTRDLLGVAPERLVDHQCAHRCLLGSRQARPEPAAGEEPICRTRPGRRLTRAAARPAAPARARRSPRRPTRP